MVVNFIVDQFHCGPISGAIHSRTRKGQSLFMVMTFIVGQSIFMGMFDTKLIETMSTSLER